MIFPVLYSSDSSSSGHEIATAERFTSYLAKYFFFQHIFMNSIMYQIFSTTKVIKTKFLPSRSFLTSGRDRHIRYFKKYEEVAQFARAELQAGE